MEEYDNILNSTISNSISENLKLKKSKLGIFSFEMLNFEFNSFSNDNIRYEIEIKHETYKWTINTSYIELENFIKSLKSLYFIFLPKLIPLSSSEEKGVQETNKSVLEFLNFLINRYDILASKFTATFLNYNKKQYILDTISKSFLAESFNFNLGDTQGMEMTDYLYDPISGLLIIAATRIIIKLGFFYFIYIKDHNCSII